MSHFLAKSLVAGLLSTTAAAGVVWFGTAPQDAEAVATEDHPHPHKKPTKDEVDTAIERDSDSASSRVAVRERDDADGSTSRNILQRMLTKEEGEKASAQTRSHDGGKEHSQSEEAELPRVLELAVRRAEANEDLEVDIDIEDNGDVTVTRTTTENGKDTVQRMMLEDANMDRDAPAIARFIRDGRVPAHLREVHDAEVKTKRSSMESKYPRDAMKVIDRAMADLDSNVSVDIEMDDRTGDVEVTRTVERNGRKMVKRMKMEDADMDRDAPAIADFITSGVLPHHLREEHDAEVETERKGTTSYDGRRRMDRAPAGTDLPLPGIGPSGMGNMERRMDRAGVSERETGMRAFEKTEPTRLLVATDTIDDRDLRDQALFSVVTYALRFDQFDVASEALDRMEGSELANTARFKIAVRKGEVGNVDGALEEIAAIDDKAFRDIYRMRLVEILATPIEERKSLPDY